MALSKGVNLSREVEGRTKKNFFERNEGTVQPLELLPVLVVILIYLNKATTIFPSSDQC